MKPKPTFPEIERQERYRLLRASAGDSYWRAGHCVVLVRGGNVSMLKYYNVEDNYQRGRGGEPPERKKERKKENLRRCGGPSWSR